MGKSSALILALFYALIVSNVDLLLGIDDEAIQDRENYLNAANNAFNEINLNNFGNLVFFLEQHFFSLTLFLINYFLLDSSSSIKFLIFFSATTTTFLLLRHSSINAVWCVPVVIFEWYAINHLIAVRQGLAATVFLIGFFATRRDIKFLCYAIAPLIHYQFFLALILFLSCRLLAVRHVDVHVRLIILAFLIVCMASLVLSIANFIGFHVIIERYSSVAGTFSPGLGYLFWLFFLCLSLMEGRYFIKRHFFAILIVMFYLIGTLMFPPFSRVLQALVVPVMIAGFELTRERRRLFRTSLVTYSVIFGAFEIASGWSVIID